MILYEVRSEAGLGPYQTLYIERSVYASGCVILLHNIRILVIPLTCSTDLNYYEMPRIYDLEDYERCEILGSTHKYCTFETILRPKLNTSPRVWNIIEVGI